MPKLERLLHLLADGRFHSGAALGESLGVGRSAVWKQVRGLEAMGVTVHAVRGKGYRLATSLELLDRDAILAAMSPAQAERLNGLELLNRVDSTNRYLNERAAAGLKAPWVCLAESQSAGRGRRGRPWVSPFGRNLYLSMLWRFEAGADGLSALSLASGVAVARVLDSLGVTGLGLKWPNDIVHQQRKLGGMLIELSGEASGPWDAVIGVGLNVDMSGPAAGDIDQPWTDLRSVLGRIPGRNDLAAAVIDGLMSAMAQFERQGFSPFKAAFERYDVARGREAELHVGPGRVKRGRVLGIGDHGALLFDCEGDVSQVTSGDLSLRIAE